MIRNIMMEIINDVFLPITVILAYIFCSVNFKL